MPTYHQRLAEQKRTAIVDAATALFLESGYDKTSLARIADAAEVSKATLFKQFPTKAELFDAIVTDYWRTEDGALTPPPGDPAAGLTVLGNRYVALLTRPGMVALFRIVIAEAPRFPELGQTQEVSKATLFKQFPTKAELFDAIVTDYWRTEDGALTPPPGDPAAGLTVLGNRYVALLTRPGMVALFRIVIAEAPRFPELGQTQFKLGKQPFFDAVRDYLAAESQAGTLVVDDPVSAATQFLGMISNFAFWPRMLLVNWAPTEKAMAKSVDEAVRTVLARYAKV
ncbi:hypothetical protein BBK82_33730 [Lentzea guizhouensis]|uniref:HTH tetR-type domain-containing protein n=1 Tax=Lentzea guizhouensis TaxID=1586287 RepID=A0A1B2HRC6_9PSEU|nr:TetR/AcrR family transcriptional regulator [Lentzea guizhouensis]ANZ40258.1 hypothetical protein BBK82_33730 [Lentzea guizhouensis]